MYLHKVYLKPGKMPFLISGGAPFITMKSGSPVQVVGNSYVIDAYLTEKLGFHVPVANVAYIETKKI